MLTTLRIKNLALVADLTLELLPGYNVLTGETGAGKSIVIGALSLVLGERAERTLLRSGTETCSVEAVMDVSALKGALDGFLQENGLEACEGNQLILKRTFSSAGANRQFVNGSPTTLATLASLGESLVDIHGPHDHQSLLHPARQLGMLDAFGNLEPDQEAFAALLARRSALASEKSALVIDEKTYAQQLDLLRFQVNEIAAARLEPRDETELEQEYRRASNAARLLQFGQAALALVSENEASLLSQAGVVGRTLQELQRVDSGAGSLGEVHAQVVQGLQELQNALSHYLDKVDIDPGRLQELEERLNLLQALKRKYGGSVAEILAFGEEARRKLQSLEQRDAELGRLNAELQKNEAELWRTGQALSARRRKLVPQLAKAVTRQLADLGFKQSRFEIALNSTEPAAASQGDGQAIRFASSGLDTIDFQFAPNPGEPPRPLRAIASSGELARVMLGLKTVLAAEDRIPVLVFDEVDANVGGETAHKVGEKMRQISHKRQVLCITHLPQVAAPASAHYVVAKQVKAGRTVTEIRRLDKAGRVAELTRMLGGQTEAARQHAEALLESSV